MFRIATISLLQSNAQSCLIVVDYILLSGYIMWLDIDHFPGAPFTNIDYVNPRMDK